MTSISDTEPFLLRPVHTQRASEAIYEQVKDLIIGGQLKAGDRLPSERKMMDAFQRSRPTIREAMRMLERSGFIHTSAGESGAVVLAPSTRNAEQSLDNLIKSNHVTVQDLAEYRLETEVVTVRWAAERRTEDDLGQMEALLETAKQMIHDYSSFISLDSEFHAMLAKAAQNEAACLITRVLSKVVDKLLRESLQKRSPEEQQMVCRKILDTHIPILQAVKNKDPDAAMAAMETHLEDFLVTI